MAKCAIINATCPQNGNEAKGRYCPHWGQFIYTREGESKVEEGCDIPVLRAYAKEVVDAGWVTGQFMTKAANTVVKASEEGRQRMLEVATNHVKAIAQG